MSIARFEGSFLGDVARLADDAVMECKICWYCYDAAKGDDVRQVDPGTPFSALPEDWRCPQCDGERSQFMVVSQSSAQERVVTSGGAGAVTALVQVFREIHATAMKDAPFCNASLAVEAVGFTAWQERQVGILVTPWFMNLVVLPGPGDDLHGYQPGHKRCFGFPSGDYEFLFNVRAPVGPYLACALFSDMGEFASQLHATDVARAAISGLFDPANRAQTDRYAEIQSLRASDVKAIDSSIEDALDRGVDDEALGHRVETSAREGALSAAPLSGLRLESRREFLTGRRDAPEGE